MAHSDSDKQDLVTNIQTLWDDVHPIELFLSLNNEGSRFDYWGDKEFLDQANVGRSAIRSVQPGLLVEPIFLVQSELAGFSDHLVRKVQESYSPGQNIKDWEFGKVAVWKK